MEDLTCEACGQSFKRRRTGANRFCSRKCNGSAQRSVQPRPCAQCATEFTPTQDKVRFCSRECFFRSRRTGEDRTCPVCEEAYYTPAGQAAKGFGKFCSKKCADTGMVRHGRTPEERWRDCDHCGGRYQAAPRSRFCSRSCAGKGTGLEKRKLDYSPRPCAVCGTVFVPTTASLSAGFGKCCSTECARVEAAKTRTVYDTSERPCKFCGDPFRPHASSVREGRGIYCSSECSRADGAPSRAGQKGAAVARSGKVTEPERILYGLLDEVAGPGQWIAQHPVDFWTVDAAIPELRLIFQADGDYWHVNPARYPDPAQWDEIQVANERRDRRQQTLLGGRGWTIMRFWESDLKRDPAAARLRIIVALEKASRRQSGQTGPPDLA